MFHTISGIFSEVKLVAQSYGLFGGVPCSECSHRHLEITTRTKTKIVYYLAKPQMVNEPVGKAITCTHCGKSVQIPKGDFDHPATISLHLNRAFGLTWHQVYTATHLI